MIYTEFISGQHFFFFDNSNLCRGVMYNTSDELIKMFHAKKYKRYDALCVKVMWYKKKDLLEDKVTLKSVFFCFH